MANTKITSNVIADGAITSAKLDSSSLAIPSTATATTQSAGDNSTKVATTAYVETAVSNLVSAAPAALDTLDELAAALGDDANFSTTITNSLALKAPLASPDFTGDATFDTSTLVVDSTNNRVGIGTTAPQRRLTVGDGSGSEVMSIYAGSTSASALHFTDTNTATDYQGFVTYDHVADGLRFGAAEAEGMRLTSTGLGIGVTSLARDPLHVHRSSTGDCQIHMTNTSTGTSSGDGMTIFANSNASGIWQRENTYFRIATNNTERFRIAAGGELTVKSDTDTIANFMNNSDNDHNIKMELVDVSDLAVIRLNGKDGGDNKFIIGYGSTHTSTPNMLALKSNTASGELGFFTNATQRMHIKPTGEVGIGTDDPFSILHIGGGGDANVPITIAPATGGSAEFRNTSSTGFFKFTKSNGSTELMRLTSDGGLAIGFTSTDAKIDAAGYIRSKHATTNGLLLNTGNDQWAIRNVSSSLSFEDDGTQRFVIDPSGRFAMGNTPSISTNYILSIDSDASGQAAGIHFTHGTKNLYLGYNSTSATDDAEMWNAANGYLRFGTNNLERVRIDSSGRWMCGVTSAIDLGQTSVEFNGTTQNGVVYRTTRSATGSTFVKFRNSSNQTIGYIYQDGSTTVNYYTNSDYRLKENVVYDWTALDRLNQLKPARYNFIGDDDVVDGFIAHELQEVMPEVVIGDKDAVKEEDGAEVPDYQGVAVSKLVPLLVKSVQELSAKVDTLEAEIEVLRNG